MAKADDKRTANIELIFAAQAKLNDLEAQVRQATLDRDKLLIRCHGERSTGGLSYEELSEATGPEDVGISRGRVIQIVQGKSVYSKRQPPRKVTV